MSDHVFAVAQQALPDSFTIHRLVADAMVRTAPDTTAVRIGGELLTYRQLDEQSDILSQAILRVASDSQLVGISCTRSLDMVVGVLAILKAGKAYLPLDPTYPDARLRQLINDSGVQHCLSTTADEPLFTELGLHVIRPDATQDGPSQAVTTQNETACVLYTSGSTGKPKGVCLTHMGLVNMLTNQVGRWAGQPGLQTLQFCHLSFDASFQEIFVPLLTGGTIHLVDDSYRLNAGRLLDYIEQERINRVFLPYVVLQYLTETAVASHRFPADLREIITGGELLKITPAIAQFFDALPGCALMNVYGPTEASVWVTENRLQGDALNWPQLPSIGRVVPGCGVIILNEQLEPVEEGEIGEIGIAGVCLANGYLNQPDRTADAFIDWQHPQYGPTRLYRTGDLARFMPDGTLDFHGRRDTQVKIRGNRVELGEIEVLLAQQPAVQQAVVVAREDIPGHKRLVAYVVVPATNFSVPLLRTALTERLPDFMLPTYYVRLDDLPRTTSGKVDKAQLPPPDHSRPDLTTLLRPARTALEKEIVGMWGEWLQLNPVGLDDNFFELGGNSLLAQQTIAALEQRGFTVPITKLYQYPTAGALAEFIQPTTSIRPGQPQPELTAPRRATADDTDVAVIGMSGRFPGASTIDELWSLLKEGRETTRFFTDAELDAAIPASVRENPQYVKARGVIDGADQFDARFFGLTPAIAQVMDPQQRIFLEIAYEALETTGYLPELYGGRVGVFAGCGNNTYYLNNVLANPDVVAQVGSFQAMTVNEKDYIASRTAYQLNLNGPAVSVYSACSTSLLAITQAVQSLRSGQCEVALAGGASITAPVSSGHLYQEGAMFSSDGHTRSFNADSTGTVFSDGAGVVLLKRLTDARRDGDTVYAVIKGIGVNNDGGNKGSFTAPNADGQAGSIRMALADAQVDPATISYVEAHGTATPVGDPIEIEGLTAAFGPQDRNQYCAIGSIKSNMGHLTQAAGVAGLIKAVLSLHYRQLPPSINYERPNPVIDFANSPFYVNATLRDWDQEQESTARRANSRRANPRRANPRRAGVSSFGVGGTNVHVVLEEFAETVTEPISDKPARPVQLLMWSAKSVASRHAFAQQLVARLQQPNAPALADVAFTLPLTRPGYVHRQFAVAASADELTQTLTSNPGINAQTLGRAPGDVVFLFPGQGAQFLNMGRALYEYEPTFRQAIDDCAEHLRPHLDVDIRKVLYPDTINLEVEQQLRNTRYTQAALFVTEYALARLWMSWGIEPSILCGHSVGEFVAAHLAGVFTLPDALRLVAARGRLVSEQPRGSMLSVRLGIDQLQPLLPDTLSVAAVNSRHLCVVAGQDEDIADFARLLDEREIPNRPLATSHAFHSAMMDPIVTQFAEIVKTVPLSRPQKPIVSTVTGTFMTDAQATDPAYWATHLRATVRFADALDTILTLDKPLLLEVGPGRSMATLARQHATGQAQPGSVLAGLATQADDKATYEALLTTLGQLYLHGLPIDWRAFYAGQNRRRVALPTYAFDRRRCWIDAPVSNPVLTELLPSYTTNQQASNSSTPPMRTPSLLNKIYQLLEDASGIEMADVAPETSFLELGFDSLLLTQMAITLRNEFGTPITFRQLTTDLTSPNDLAAFLDQQLPADQYAPAPVAVPAPVAAPVSQPAPMAEPVMPAMAPMPMAAAPALMPVGMVGGDSALGLIAQQLQLLARQVALMQGVPAQPAPVAPPVAVPPAPTPQPVAVQQPIAPPAPPIKPATLSVPTTGELTPEEAIEHKKPFGATAKIERQTQELTQPQQQFLAQLTQRYNSKTAGSKAYAQQHRAQMADPRVVSGFRPLTKEIVYPIVVNRSAGSRLWDVDGNEYIDVLNGFGSNMFGYQPDFIKKALHEQIEKGFEVGPQHELAGEVSQLVCELTGSERVALCNTGSEAVLGAMRVARTITGRSLIVAFAGSYHGIVDEVLVRGSKKLKTFPAASGIMANVVQNMLILDYGTDESLRIIRERADELAAVLVEPIQSRRPEFVPIDFLNELRSITTASGSALIFDEVITGFRMHLGGAQALLGIRADMATYGKVAGAGMSIGIIAGKRSFMDALDGGHWQYGDASAPEVGVTYFAGTFVRHPLALAAAKASMLHLREQGVGLQQALTRKTTYLADTLNTYLTERQLPMFIAHFGSLWKLKFTEDVPYAELLFTLMREKGIHIWDGFPCFMTEAHTDEELSTVIDAFCRSIDTMIDATFFPGKSVSTTPPVSAGSTLYQLEPPVAGARLGRDRAGNPAWFLPDPERPGAYLQVDLMA
ncbi:polyketide synthase [Spirosoma rhododendri]|uniref:Amino acid adenylation domain-containing protein n=1 Tax=Spirosoma rhododendri TaxID=2728024 RepID=A0A7L5DUN5_9BACT|nr:polyketide synthase [Spirosoma rhododendri]QJD79270.1 amino acid adenylation domain-containing protein [Spirosoma rhododendri]